MPMDPFRLQEVFDAALTRPAGAPRDAYLDESCVNDPELRQRVEALLSAHHSAGSFLELPPAVATVAPTLPLREAPGTRIGHYKLLQQIGEGGFGVVFMAEQEQPVRRTVALKIIKLGMDTRQVVARFEAERQALAMMDHPNVARVFDAGATESGRPYFVMELVKGTPITDYCDGNNLDIVQRLELLMQVCQAVQHAHQKGLIHRDIKPSNVLISRQDDRPMAKVIDFGIAKATQARLTEKTLFTEFQQLIGTPEYMSPEQAEGSLDIDTRSDVYSLGVLLYELLTGSPPFDGKELRSKAYAEMRRMIREVYPPTPSARLSRATETIGSVAARRAVEPGELRSLVRGELDWIVMKALEKDRRRRYESAAALGSDLRRYLLDEPISAGAPTRLHRIRRFVRRHKGPVIASSAVLIVLVAGFIGTTIGLIGQSRQREIAEQQRAEAQKQEREARTQTAIASAVGRFQAEMLASADPERMLGEKVTVLQVIASAVSKLDAGSLSDQPLVEAAVRQTIGNTLRTLGRYDDAERHLQRSLELRQQTLPAGHPEIGGSLNDLGLLLQHKGRIEAAEQHYRAALAIGRKTLGDADPQLGAVVGNLAWLLAEQGRYAESEQLAREGLDIARKSFQGNHPDLANAATNLAMALHAQGKFPDAEPLYREALAIDQNAPPPGRSTLGLRLSNLAMLLQDQHRSDEAEKVYREALEINQRALPANHRQIGLGKNNLSLLLYYRGNLAEAEPLARDAVEIYRVCLPPGHHDLAMSMNNLALILQRQGNLTEAETLLRQAMTMMRQNLPPGHPSLANICNNLASVLLQQGKPVEAEPLFREALPVLARTVGLTDWRAGVTREGLGRALLGQDRFAEAEPELLEAERVLSLAPGLQPGRHTVCIRALALLYEKWNESEPDGGYAAKARAWRSKLPSTQPATSITAGSLEVRP